MADAPPVVQSMTGIVEDAVELERPPSPSDLGEEHTLRPVPWRVRLRSAAIGVALGVFLWSVLASALTIGGPGWDRAVAAAVASGVACVVVTRRGGDVDPRWVAAPITVSALVAIVLPQVRLPFPAVLAVGAVLIILQVCLAQFQRGLTTTRRLVLAWNDAFSRLAESPRRAVTCELHVTTIERAGRRRVEGSVTYVAEDGTQHTVALVSAPAIGLDLPANLAVDARSPAVTWHAADHSVVLTRVLGTPV